MPEGQTVFTTAGYWALGVVIIYLAASAGFRCAFAAGEYIHDLSTEVQALFGRIVFGTFLIALLYLMVWGCYMLGERSLAFAGTFF